MQFGYFLVYMSSGTAPTDQNRCRPCAGVGSWGPLPAWLIPPVEIVGIFWVSWERGQGRVGSGGTFKSLRLWLFNKHIKKIIKCNILPTRMPVKVRTVQIPGLLVKDAENPG